MMVDTDVLKQLAFWLGEAYKTTVQLSGIIYLHRITDDRMSGSSLRNLTMFKKLCGENAFQHIKLATTMWKNLNGPNLSYDTGVAREKELLDRKEWWGLMCERGSSVVRHDGTKECAMEMIEDLIQRRNQGGPVVLDIQKEMVDEKLSLENTSAGMAVDQELNIAKRSLRSRLPTYKSLTTKPSKIVTSSWQKCYENRETISKRSSREQARHKRT